jgi:Uma2 family endonuclease
VYRKVCVRPATLTGLWAMDTMATMRYETGARRLSRVEYESEPEPDVAIVPGDLDDYAQAHPSRPVLTVEVSDSSLAADRERKGSLYARAGLADYWVLNLIDRVLEVYREPAPDSSAPYGWRYARREVFDARAEVVPLAC